MDIMQNYSITRELSTFVWTAALKLTTEGKGLCFSMNKTQSTMSFFSVLEQEGFNLNLQTADTVILFDSDWNPQMDLQGSR